MSNESCYLCTETDIHLWKICSCASSYLCDDCLKLTESNINKMDSDAENRYKCHICRQNLDFDLYPSSKYYRELFKHFFPKIFFLIIDILIIFAIVNHSKTEYPSMFFTHPAMFVVLNFFNVVLVKNACYTFLEHVYKIPHTDFQAQNIYYVSTSLINIMLFSMCFLDSNIQVQDLYFILVNGFIIGLAFLVMSLMVILDRNGDIEKFIRIKYQRLKIRVHCAYFPNITNNENAV